MNRYLVSHLYEFTPDVEAAMTERDNPLTTPGALDEAEFIDMRLSPQRSRAGVLCDIQWCRDFEGSNAAVVIVNGVDAVEWSNDDQTRRRPWHAAYGNWVPGQTSTAGTTFPSPTADSENTWAVDAFDASTSLRAGGATADPSINYTLRFGRLLLSGLSARIYIGHVEGLDGAPPDMGELSDAEILAGYPQWSSVLEVHEQYAFPAPRTAPGP